MFTLSFQAILIYVVLRLSLSFDPLGTDRRAHYAYIFVLGGLAIASLSLQSAFVSSVLAIIVLTFVHVGLGRLRTRLEFLPPDSPKADAPARTVLFQHGKWYAQALRKEQIFEQDVVREAQRQGLQSLDDIEQAIVGPDGIIQITKR